MKARWLVAASMALLMLYPMPAVAMTTSNGYDLTLIHLPNLASLSTWLYNYRVQYPTIAFSGPCAGNVVYINNASKLACYTVATNTETNLSAPLTMLYQQTSGIQAQIDNEFQFDTPYDVALLYGNLTTSAGPVTLEAVNMTTGAVKQATTPVPMANSIQADYLGANLAVTWNASGTNGGPEMTNLSNGTSWRSGLAVGVAPNNVYWVASLGSFIDVAGTHIAQLQVQHSRTIIRNIANVFVNRTGLNQVNAVDGVVYAGGKLAVDLATNLGSYIAVVPVVGGVITQSGAYAYLSPHSLYIQRYAYTTPYVWSRNGATVLFNPFNNSTLPAPDVVSRQDSSGANGNFELTDPYTTDHYLSLNASLVGAPFSRWSFVWASKSAGAGVGPTVFGAGLALIAVGVGVVLLGGTAYGATRKRGRGRPERMNR